MVGINLNCGIYQIRNIITNVCYTGQSIDIKDRERHHWGKLKNNKHDNVYLQRSYNKHGKEFFVFEILMYCMSKNLTLYEQMFYDTDKSHGLSYNIRKCVDSNKGIKFSDSSKKGMSGKNHHMWGKHPSEETREKLSEASRGKNNPFYGKHHSKESVEKMSKAKKGKPSPMKGKHHSEETIEKMRISRQNISEETRKKMSENHADVSGKNNPNYGVRGKDSPNFGRHHTEEAKAKMATAKSGKNNPNYGKTPSEKTRRKQSLAKKGKKNANYGKPMSDEQKQKISATTKGINHWRITKKETVLQIIDMFNKGISQKNIVKGLGIGRKTVYRVKNGWYDDIYDL